MASVMTIRFAALSSMALLGGCIAYAPSNTDWGKTAKVVLQVCSPSARNGKAEIILYRSQPMLSFGFGASYPARGRTVTGQEVFESMLEDPSPLHDAIGVLIHGETPQSFYVFAIPTKYSADWSPWNTPIGTEEKPLPEVDRFKYQRGAKPLEAAVLRDAPRLRTRLEFPAEYNDRSRTKERYQHIPDC